MDSFTSKVSGSPARARQHVGATPTKPGPNARHKATYSLSSSGDDDDESHVASTTFSELMPGRQPDIFAARGDPSLAARRQMHVPAPIQVDSRRVAGARAFHQPAQPQPVSPLSMTRNGHDGSERMSSAHPSGPDSDACRSADAYTTDSSRSNALVTEMYSAWASMRSTGDFAEPPPRKQSLAQRPRRSKSTSEGLVSEAVRRNSAFRSSSPPPPALPAQKPDRVTAWPGGDAGEDQPFSPLALYFCGRDFPTQKKGEKTLIGRNGWLERTERSSPEKEKKAPPKRAGILESIKKMAKDVVSGALHDGAESRPTETNEKCLIDCRVGQLRTADAGGGGGGA